MKITNELKSIKINGENFKDIVTLKSNGSIKISKGDLCRVESNDINDTVNYLSVYQTIKRVFEEPSHLLEHIAKRIGDTLLKEYPQMEYCKIKITKKNPPLGGKLEGVSVSLLLKRTESK